MAKGLNPYAKRTLIFRESYRGRRVTMEWNAKKKVYKPLNGFWYKYKIGSGKTAVNAQVLVHCLDEAPKSIDDCHINSLGHWAWFGLEKNPENAYLNDSGKYVVEKY